ncbi:MAG: methyl-accepting chemotaxis protein [Planctomycetota bacterium]|nr:methyl-accepting chemotaxis protein [Planctomycetota bacterium]
MNHLRLRTKLGLIVGLLVFCVVVVAVVGYVELGVVNRHVERMVEVTSKARGFVSDMRSNLQGARRMEFRAVLATSDKKSKEYADISRERVKLIDENYRALSDMIEASPTSPDRQLLTQFDQSWQVYRKLNEQTLVLAIENSNIKANGLTNGKLLEKIAAVQQSADAWLRQLEQAVVEAPAGKEDPSATSSNAKRHLLERLRFLAIDLHRRLTLNVFDATDERMDQLDEQVTACQQELEILLNDLSRQATGPEAPWLVGLTGGWRELKPMVAQMQKWLRMDTNSRSAELVNEANSPIDDCMTALTGLNKNVTDRLTEGMKDVQTGSRYAQWLMLVVPLLGIAVSLALAFVLTRSITVPMVRGVEFSDAVAQGDLTKRLGLTQRDEVGLLAHALDRIAAGFGKIVGDIRGVSQGIAGSASELSAVSHQLLAQSEQMTAQAGHVAGSTEQMATNVNTMAAAGEEMSMNVASISSASEQISVNVGTISSAAEATARNVTTVVGAIQESTRAFEMISHDAREGSQIANRAMTMADGASTTMRELDRSAADIGKVTGAIKMIALQTNLLALNATIEATSAGEAGKGFAVVAHEIKELANQSAQAAEDIARKIDGVQSSTRDAVEVIREVQQIIYALNTSSMRISEAVEKQSVSAKASAENLGQASQGVEHIARSISEVAKGANDMSRNASEAATGANDMSRNAAEAATAVGDISSNIHGVSQATRDNTASAQQVNAAAERLAAIATQLQQLVGQFKIKD